MVFADAIYMVLVWGVGALQYLIVMGSLFGTPQQALTSTLLVLAVVVWAYGILCFSGNTLGTLASGIGMFLGCSPRIWRISLPE